MIDMFFPRDKVLGLADGDLSWFRRAWTYHHAGHMDNPDPFWRYRTLMTVAGALGVAPVPGAPPATGASPAPAPSDNRSWGYYGERERSEHAGWHGGGGWDGWRGRDDWSGHSLLGGRVRPRPSSGQPRKPGDSGPDDTRTDGCGGSRRRRLSSAGVSGGSSAFACDLRLGLFGEVIDVDDGRLVRLHDSRGNPRSATVARDEWLRHYQLGTSEEDALPCDGVSAYEPPVAPVGDRRTGGTLLLGPPDRSVTGGSPLLAITLPDWGVPPGPPVPIPWAKWEGRHGEVLDTDVPNDCDSDGAVTHTDSCDSSCTALARPPRGRRAAAPRPYLDLGSRAADPTESPGDGAWLAGGDLIDVVRATGLRDGWTEDEILRAQAKVRSAAARKRPPDWPRCLERATEWVDVAPLPSPVAEARMPSWAKGLLLARVSRVPSSAGLVRKPARRLPDGPAPSTPSLAASGVSGLKRKRGLSGCEHDTPAGSAESAHVGLRDCGIVPAGSVGDAVPASSPRVKSESPSYSPVSGEDSVATGYSGEEEDDGGTYLCPGWAIKHRPPHLVYTSAYQGDDLTGAFWADANPGEGVAMRVVDRPADTAVDSLAEDDEGATPTPGAAPSGSDAPAQRGTDAVCPRLRDEAGDAERASLPPDPQGGHLPLPRTPMHGASRNG